MGDLSPHFSRSEFRCRHCGKAPIVDPQLVVVLERIRSISGAPLRILSGYRCPEHNAAVRGAPRSQHLLGRAADIPAGRATLGQARAAGATGVGIRDGWAVHVDTRPGAPATWHY